MTHAQQGAWTRAVLMGIYVAITAFPFYWMFITAFKTNSDLYTLSNNPLWFNELPTFGHIIYLFQNTRFGTWMLNSAIIGVCVVLITLVDRHAGRLRAGPARPAGREPDGHGDLRDVPGPADAAVHSADPRRLLPRASRTRSGRW